MGRAKITVIGKDFYPEFNKYVKNKHDGPCGNMEIGDVFYTSGKNCDDRPEGFCPYAWNAIKKYAMTFASGGRVNLADVRVACCNDGISPVYFAIEADKQ